MTTYTKRFDHYDRFFIGLLILVIIILLMTRCTKEDIPDCQCWLITDQGGVGEWQWFEIVNECSGRGDIVYWHESLKVKWQTGNTVCELQRI